MGTKRRSRATSRASGHTLQHTVCPAPPTRSCTTCGRVCVCVCVCARARAGEQAQIRLFPPLHRARPPPLTFLSRAGTLAAAHVCRSSSPVSSSPSGSGPGTRTHTRTHIHTHARTHTHTARSVPDSAAGDIARHSLDATSPRSPVTHFRIPPSPHLASSGAAPPCSHPPGQSARIRTRVLSSRPHTLGCAHDTDASYGCAHDTDASYGYAHDTDASYGCAHDWRTLASRYSTAT